MENGDVLLPRCDPGTNREVPQGVHDPRDIDRVWASNAAGVTGSTDPDGLRTKNPVAVTVLDVPEHLVWKKIHRLHHGAARCTFLALITGLEILTAGLDNLRQKSIPPRNDDFVRIHRFSLMDGGCSFQIPVAPVLIPSGFQ
jgi:hypothetical protein